MSQLRKLTYYPALDVLARCTGAAQTRPLATRISGLSDKFGELESRGELLR